MSDRINRDDMMELTRRLTPVSYTHLVGFIRKLPHHLIEAFKSTLEEAKYSDIILHVVDCSNPNMDMQMHVVYETLRELEVEDKIIVTVFNKTDKKTDDEFPRDLKSDYQVRISAKTGEGLGAVSYTHLAFGALLMESNGFCLHHFADVLEICEEKLNPAEREAWVPRLGGLMEKNLDRIQADIDWLIEKYDYRNKDADWKQSKDAVQRTMQKLSLIHI